MSSNKRHLSKDITGLPKKTRHDVSAVSTTNTVRCLHTVAVHFSMRVMRPKPKQSQHQS